jgi:hypothetical protein
MLLVRIGKGLVASIAVAVTGGSIMAKRNKASKAQKQGKLRRGNSAKRGKARNAAQAKTVARAKPKQPVTPVVETVVVDVTLGQVCWFSNRARSSV